MVLFDNGFPVLNRKRAFIQNDSVNAFSGLKDPFYDTIGILQVKGEGLFQSFDFGSNAVTLRVGERKEKRKLSVLNKVLAFFLFRPANYGFGRAYNADNNIYAEDNHKHQSCVSAGIGLQVAQQTFRKKSIHYRSSNSAAGVFTALLYSSRINPSFRRITLSTIFLMELLCVTISIVVW